MPQSGAGFGGPGGGRFGGGSPGGSFGGGGFSGRSSVDFSSMLQPTDFWIKATLAR